MRTLPILIFGASGYTGNCIKATLEREFECVFGTYHTEKEPFAEDSAMFRFELGDMAGLESLLERVDPEVIISCLTGDFNQQLTAHRCMADFLAKKETGRLIYLSTANVFDGSVSEPHWEMDEPLAESDYGQFKIACERLILDRLGDRAVILRLPEIWGKDCPRLVRLREQIRQRTPIPTYANLFINYTTNLQIAQWISYLLQKDLRGIFHVGTGDMAEYVQFQRQVAETMDLGEPVFDIQQLPERCVQAVLPGRPEIPPELRLEIKDILSNLNACGKE